MEETQRIITERPDKIKLIKGQRDSYGYEITITTDFKGETTGDVIKKVKELKRNLKPCCSGARGELRDCDKTEKDRS